MWGEEAQSKGRGAPRGREDLDGISCEALMPSREPPAQGFWEKGAIVGVEAGAEGCHPPTTPPALSPTSPTHPGPPPALPPALPHATAGARGPHRGQGGRDAGRTVLPGGLGGLRRAQALCLQVVLEDDDQGEVAGSQRAQDAAGTGGASACRPGGRGSHGPTGTREEMAWGTGCPGVGHHGDSPGGTWSTSGSQSPWGQRAGR